MFFASTIVSITFFALTLASSTHRDAVKGDRLQWLSEIQEPNLGQLISQPKITIPELVLTRESWPGDLKSQEDFSKVEPLFELVEKEDYDEAYIQAEKASKKLQRSNQGEWVKLLKADLYFKVQGHRGEPQWSMVLEEYQDFMRDFPLHSDNARVLYQIALVQLKMKFLRDCDQTIQRALKEYPNTQLDPYFHLLWGEQAFVGNDDAKANFEFSYIIHY